MRSFTASWVPNPSSSISNAGAAGGGSWASPVPGGSSSFVGPGKDSTARVGTRSGDERTRRLGDDEQEGKET
jgi:hypothetical protein